MGNCLSQDQGRAESARIDRDIRMERQNMERTPTVKLLLLGSGESGKSTVLKQFRLIHGTAYTDAERSSYRPAILGNLINCGKTLVEGAERLGIPFGSDTARRMALVVWEAPSSYGEGELVSPAVAEALQVIWKDEGIQTAFLRSNEFQLMDSCKYYMDEAARLCAPNYVPNIHDILRTRVMTTTITESKFIIEGIQFRIYDVGGQRSERKKWAPYFDDCTAIIFISAISSYDQTCFEDNTTNRMIESMTLFEQIVNHPLFRQTAMILFLNKIDLFREKVNNISIQRYFPQYEGPNDFESACEFFAKRFVALNRSQQKKIYIHYTWATDTTQIRTVLATVNAIILRLNLEASGI
ncbi:guanine nucleotide binding protein, alpha subunit [Cladochytrium replicatum]|nr:guanine nucleotide binding protein, alpha subunit [Cladochytrium replicatum]